MERGEQPKIPSFEEFMAARNANKQQNANPLGGDAKPSVPKPVLPTFDVDNLVKRIDAKIAEFKAKIKNNSIGKKIFAPKGFAKKIIITEVAGIILICL